MVGQIAKGITFLEDFRCNGKVSPQNPRGLVALTLNQPVVSELEAYEIGGSTVYQSVWLPEGEPEMLLDDKVVTEVELLEYIREEIRVWEGINEEVYELSAIESLLSMIAVATQNSFVGAIH